MGVVGSSACAREMPCGDGQRGWAGVMCWMDLLGRSHQGDQRGAITWAEARRLVRRGRRADSGRGWLRAVAEKASPLPAERLTSITDAKGNLRWSVLTRPGLIHNPPAAPASSCLNTCCSPPCCSSSLAASTPLSLSLLCFSSVAPLVLACPVFLASVAEGIRHSSFGHLILNSLPWKYLSGQAWSEPP